MSRHRPEWTRTIRFRLTVTYSLLLFGLAALVVGGIYLGLSRSLDAQPVARTFDVQKQYRGLLDDASHEPGLSPPTRSRGSNPPEPLTRRRRPRPISSTPGGGPERPDQVVW